METIDALGAFISSVENRVDNAIDSRVDERFMSLEQILKKATTLKINVNGVENELTGLKHKQLSDIITIAANRIPALLVGSAGTGKTHACEQVAEGLKVPFFAMSVGAQTSKADLLGYMSATGEYITTAFRKAFEFGGVFLMDEIDAGNSNVLIILNSALSNNYCSFPDGMVKKHKDFIFLGSANTFGNGANRVYVGRNQLDAATLDRFAFVEWTIDESLEGAVVAKFTNGEKWHKVVKAVRAYAEKNMDRALVTPRATMRGAALLDAGMKFDQVVKVAILGAIPPGKHKETLTVAKSAWSN